MARVKDYQGFFDGEALKRAREYFAIDNDDLLMAMMAEVLFGRHKRGRSKGTVTWTSRKYMELGEAYAEIHAKDPKLSDTKIAELLCQDRRLQELPRRSSAPAAAPKRKVSSMTTAHTWRQRGATAVSSRNKGAVVEIKRATTRLQ